MFMPPLCIKKPPMRFLLKIIKDGTYLSILPRCHLALEGFPSTLFGILTYPRQLTYAFTSQNTRQGLCTHMQFPSLLAAPSVVHLTDCVLPVLSYPGSLCVHELFLSPHLRFMGDINFKPLYVSGASLSTKIFGRGAGSVFPHFAAS